MPNEWIKMDTQYGPVEWMFEWNDLLDHLHVRVGDRTIIAPAAAKIVQNYSMDGAVKALAKELYALIDD